MRFGLVRVLSAAACALLASPALAYSIKVVPQLAGYDDAPAHQGGVPATLTVASAGWFDDAAMTVAGTGCVVSGTAGCTKYATGAVTLTATTGANTTFVGWTGCNSVAGNVCTVNASHDRSLTASFRPAAFTIRLATQPRPMGTWTPPYGGTVSLDGCPLVFRSTRDVPYTSCMAPFGATVYVIVRPDPGSRVKAVGGCTPVAPNDPSAPPGAVCWFKAYEPRTITVAFESENQCTIRAAVVRGLIRSGATATSPDYMNCSPYGGDCIAVGPTCISPLEPVCPPDSKFAGWTGCSRIVGGACCVDTCGGYITATCKRALSSCSNCHSTTHSGKPMDCGSCHLGYETVPHPIRIEPPIIPVGHAIDVSIVSVARTETQITSVMFKVTDAATGAGVTGLNATVHLGKLRADGTYRSYYRRTATGANYVVDGQTIAPALATALQDTSATGTLAGGANAGEYVYTFGTAVAPAAGDSTIAAGDEALTHIVALYTTRTVNTYNFRGYDAYSFVPSAGGAEVPTRSVVTDAACNACHGQLQLHGQRRGVANCLVCHNPDSIDPETGNTVDMATMIHKIHNGHLLANGYTVVGYQQNVYDFSHIAMAPSHAGYLEGGGIYSTAHDPGLARECGICHGTSLTNEAYTKPTRRACGACHDDVDFAVGHYPNGSGGFIVGPQTSDANCTGCHAATAVEKVHSKFYASGVTTTGTKYGVDFRTDVTPGVPAGGHKFQAQIVSVENFGTQLKWTLDFKIDNGAGLVPYDIKSAVTSANGVNNSFVLAACTFQISGPNADYVLPATGGNTGGSCATPANWTAVLDASSNPIPGRFSHLAANYFTAAPAKPAGYYTAAFEMMLSRQWSPTAAADRIRKPFAADPNFITLSVDAAGQVTMVTDPAELLAKARRTVVEYGKCNTCHEDLGFHSNRNRQGPDYCATCHNPMLDNGTRARIPVAEAYTIPGTTQLGYLPESVSMNVFIHRIHMGKRLPSVAGTELTGTSNSGAALRSPWVADQVGSGSIVYGATRSNFVGTSDTAAPQFADLTAYAQPNYVNRCEQCHIDSGSKQTWGLPELSGLAPVVREYRACLPVDVSWDTADWCNVLTPAQGGNNNGLPKLTQLSAATGGATANLPAKKVYTPPLKASCTSCHDSAATDAHADLFTVNPMTAGATEFCAGCHGAGKSFDSLVSHRRVP